MDPFITLCPPKRVLIIDDDHPTLLLYQHFLSKSNCTVVSAENLATGLEKLAGGEFDAVILDMRLPDGIAIDAIPGIRARNAAIKIFVVSGLLDPSVADAAREAGADEYLVKPLDFKILCNDIVGLLSKTP